MSNLIHSVLGFKKMSPAQKIALSFLFVILVGAFLLTMPFSNKNGQFLNPIDALFMATSATCVTGLGVVTVADQFNLFGQIVMMLSDSGRWTRVNDIYGDFCVVAEKSSVD